MNRTDRVPILVELAFSVEEMDTKPVTELYTGMRAMKTSKG